MRAKGLCSTHYNQRYIPDRHPRVEVPCTVCGATVVRARDSRRLPTCSVTCRTLLQHGVLSGVDHYDWACDAQRRALRLGATTAHRVERDDILKGDGWRCYLCHIDTRIATSPFDPRSATVDHVVPISKGGQHVRENLRCCCLGCNSSKQALLIDELTA
ncbi:HNH endonuclease [Aeromicrobium piscarium]|nr:HNH endonuclease [Aeromicrobium piscarium]